LSSRYPFPWKTGFQLLLDAILLRPRNFRQDALSTRGLLSQPPLISNQENVPSEGPCLLVMNHYNQPDFGPWWIALGITIAVPIDIHWLMTAAWTFPNDPLLRPFTPFTYWLFSRVAQVYGFTNMPPMPPDPRQTEYRANSVRQALRYARTAASPVIALAPEGRDHPGGILGTPPPGVGRFIARLMKYCKVIVPVGIYEDDGHFCLRFGRELSLELNEKGSRETLETRISQSVMDAIALQLPERLRGAYGIN